MESTIGPYKNVLIYRRRWRISRAIEAAAAGRVTSSNQK